MDIMKYLLEGTYYKTKDGKYGKTDPGSRFALEQTALGTAGTITGAVAGKVASLGSRVIRGKKLQSAAGIGALLGAGTGMTVAGAHSIKRGLKNRKNFKTGEWTKDPTKTHDKLVSERSKESKKVQKKLFKKHKDWGYSSPDQVDQEVVNWHSTPRMRQLDKKMHSNW